MQEKNTLSKDKTRSSDGRVDAIEVIGIRKEFSSNKKKVLAVNGVSFSVRKGEIFGLLGPNGAGKSTIINMILGLVKKDAGEIRILGKDPEKEWEYVKNRINATTAYYDMLGLLTVKQNLMIYAKVYNIKNPEHKIRKLLRLFEIEHLENKQARSLSSGENTRLLLCKGLINDPEVLFLDECTVGLDPDIAEKTRKAITAYHNQTGCTILFTSHYMHEVEELCNRIAFMDHGKIIGINTADNLKKRITTQIFKITVKARPKELVKLLRENKARLKSVVGRKIVFEVDLKNDNAYKLLNKIFTQGFLLDDLEIKKPTLEDIFIRIARSQKPGGSK